MDKPGAVCPYLDRCDARCAERLTMTNLRVAFEVCISDHEGCRVYHQIRLAEQRCPVVPAACSA